MPLLLAGFADSSIATGGFAVAWTSLRFSLQLLGGPFAGPPLRLVGVKTMSGLGVTIEGVNLVWGADGSGQALKITQGRENPDEITWGCDPDTLDTVILPRVRSPQNGRKYLFNATVQKVDSAGVSTRSRVLYGCTLTGFSEETPEGGDPHTYSFKFKPTRIGA